MKLASEISAHKSGQGKDGTIRQLENFHSEIEQMVESKAFIPSYPIAIVDTWDFTSNLANNY